MVAAILKRTVLEHDGPLYDLVTCWRVVKSMAMNLSPLWNDSNARPSNVFVGLLPYPRRSSPNS